MNYLYISVLLIILWLINLLIIRKLHAMSALEIYIEKSKNNSANILLTFVGLGLTAFSFYVWDFLKWIIILYYGICGGIQAIMFLFSFISTIAVSTHSYVSTPEKALIGSNFIELVSMVILFVFALQTLF